MYGIPFEAFLTAIIIGLIIGYAYDPPLPNVRVREEFTISIKQIICGSIVLGYIIIALLLLILLHKKGELIMIESNF